MVFRARLSTDVINQIDANYLNLALAQKGSATSGQVLSFPGRVMPALAIRPSGNTRVIAVEQRFDGSAFYFRARAVGGAGNDQGFDWWLFDSYSTLPDLGGSGPRLRIRRPSDLKLVFDSRYKALRVVQSLEIGVDTQLSAYVTVPAGRTYAGFWVQRLYGSDDNPNGTDDTNWSGYMDCPAGGAQIGLGTIVTTADATGSSPFPSYTYPGSYVGRVILVDVTGY